MCPVTFLLFSMYPPSFTLLYNPVVIDVTIQFNYYLHNRYLFNTKYSVQTSSRISLLYYNNNNIPTTVHHHINMSSSKSKTPNNIVHFNDFISIPLKFLYSIGVIPFHLLDANNKYPPNSFRIFPLILFVLSFLNLGLLVIGEMIFFVKTFGNFVNFIEETALVLCIGFILLSFVKVITISWKKDQMSRLMTNLERLFPKTKDIQCDYKIEKYLHQTMLLTRIYSIVQMGMIWCFNFYPMSETIIGYVRHRTWKVDFPYYIWYPFNPYAPGFFELNYLSQMWAAYVAAAAILAADVLLCGVVIQICMHFDHLKQKIIELKPTKYNRNIEFARLKQYIKTHNEIIRYTI